MIQNKIKKEIPVPLSNNKGWPWDAELFENHEYSGLSLPKISITIPSYNQGQFLEETIRSILSQNYPNTEIIVIDGGSSDNSLDIIKHYSDFIFHWQSKKDKGQSDALNQGFKISTGTFLTWLNSDDLLLPGTLFHLSNNIISFPNVKWFAGNLMWISSEGEVELCRKGESWNKRLIGRGILNLYGPTSFFKKELLLEFGYLREDFHYLMDTELWWRLASNNIDFKRLSCYCWAYRLHENSKMSGHHFQSSQLSDKEHPSWKQKRWEHNKISELYHVDLNISLLVKLELVVIRLFSIQYLTGWVDQFQLKRKNLSGIFSKRS